MKRKIVAGSRPRQTVVVGGNRRLLCQRKWWCPVRLFAIRDDDVSFFTNWQDLDHLYAALSGRVPISFGVVPFAVPHRGSEAQSIEQSKSPALKALHENTDLVECLRARIRRDDTSCLTAIPMSTV